MPATAQPSTTDILRAVQAAGEDHEWYPTTDRMIDVVAARIRKTLDADCYRSRRGEPWCGSILDVGAGDGRVLVKLAAAFGDQPTLYAIEKSTVLVQAQPENVVPVGTDLFEQNLTCLRTDVIFCNPPYSDFERWVEVIVSTGYAARAYLVIPRRWKDSTTIANAMTARKATATVIHSDDFLDGERRARAVVDIVEVKFPCKETYGFRGESHEPLDPFDAWFDANVKTFDAEADLASPANDVRDVTKNHKTDSIGGLVAAFDEEYARMQANYEAIFKLDHAILKELGVSKDKVREGLKARAAGLKVKYWKLCFDRLETITKRLSTATKKRFLEKLTGQTSVAFTVNNAIAVVLWSIKHANRYYDEQVVTLFKDLSTFDGVLNYKSNQRTWDRSAWRYMRSNNAAERARGPSHYGLDYRIVLEGSRGIDVGYSGRVDGLRAAGRELIADLTAVFYNLGFALAGDSTPASDRHWSPGQAVVFALPDGSPLFRVKAFLNGNLHLQVKPDAIKALNVEAARLLRWISSPADVVTEMGYSAEEAERYFGSTHKLTSASVRMLAGPVSAGSEAA
jgi:hypothetical protein